MKGKKSKSDKRETREHKGPLKVPIPFDEAMKRVMRVKPPEKWQAQDAPKKPPKKATRGKKAG